MLVSDDKSVSDNSDDDVADEEEMLGQTSFFEKKNLTRIKIYPTTKRSVQE